MSLARVIPNGKVDAHCIPCHRDVVIPEGSLACPHCGRDVEPTSLARLPQEHRARAAAEPKPPAEPITLPDWVDGAKKWRADTVKLSERMAKEEAELVADLRRVRTFRKILEAVLERVEPAD